jgi:hypothetical protein
MSDLPHHCSACGEVHGGSGGDSAEVRIAKIQADRDIEVARLQRAEMRQDIEATVAVAELGAETEVEVATVEAESGVVAAEAVAEALAPPEPEPAVVEVPVTAPDSDETEGDVPAPAAIEKTAPKSDGGYWAGYDKS